MKNYDSIHFTHSFSMNTCKHTLRTAIGKPGALHTGDIFFANNNNIYTPGSVYSRVSVVAPVAYFTLMKPYFMAHASDK